jgi:hypothetical protein
MLCRENFLHVEEDITPARVAPTRAGVTLSVLV